MEGKTEHQMESGIIIAPPLNKTTGNELGFYGFIGDVVVRLSGIRAHTRGP